MKPLVSVFLPVPLLVITSLAAHAHHSHANLDPNDKQLHRGTVERYVWGMPHVFLKVMAPNTMGELVEYTIELPNPPGMVARGWSRDSFKQGDPIVWYGASDRNPNRYYSGLDWAEKGDGTRLYAGPGNPSKEAGSIEPGIEPSRDMSGLWARGDQRGGRVFYYSPPEDWPYTAAGREAVENFDTNDNPQIECIEPGPPKSIMLPYPFRITRPDEKTFVFEYELRQHVRKIVIGEEPPVGKPSIWGRSVGRMEGEQLVIETDNFVADKWSIQTGVDSSDQKHLVERYTLLDDGLSLLIQFTITDPVYLTEPLVLDHYMTKIPDREVMQIECTLENSRLYLDAGFQ